MNKEEKETIQAIAQSLWGINKQLIDLNDTLLLVSTELGVISRKLGK